MKKNNKVIIISIVVILIIVGGIFGFYKYKENKIQNMVNKGVEYLNQKEYEKAITAFDFVLEEKSNDTEALQLKGIIGKYLEAKKLFDNGNIEEANKLINEIGEEGSNYKGFNSDVNNLKDQITTYMKKIQEINDYINKAKDLIKEKKYNDAKTIIEKLEKDKLNDNQKKEIEDLKKIINSELQKEKEEAIKEEKAKQAKKEKENKEKVASKSNEEKSNNKKNTEKQSFNENDAFKLARAYADKVDLRDVVPMGVVEIPGEGKKGWEYSLRHEGEMRVFIDYNGTLYSQVAGEVGVRKE